MAVPPQLIPLSSVAVPFALGARAGPTAAVAKTNKRKKKKAAAQGTAGPVGATSSADADVVDAGSQVPLAVVADDSAQAAVEKAKKKKCVLCNVESHDTDRKSVV